MYTYKSVNSHIKSTYTYMSMCSVYTYMLTLSMHRPRCTVLCVCEHVYTYMLMWLSSSINFVFN